MVVYLDEIFAVNLLMDVVVLWAVGKLSMRTLSWWRMIAAGLVGALYGTIIFLPGCIWLANGIYKMICSLIMVLVGFGIGSWQALLKTVVYLYLVSFAFGGGTVALMYFFGEQAIQTWNGIALVQVDFSLLWLFGATVLLMFFVKALANPLHKRLEQTLPIVTVQVVLRGKAVSLRLLVDSGNCLTDPVTNQSVAVVDICYLSALFTDTEYALLQTAMQQDGVDITEVALLLPTLASRIRLIPYQAVGIQGLLLGIRCDCLQVAAWNYEKQNTVLALSTHPFADDGAYQGIIAPI